MKKLDLLNTPLNGANLIEASAGTGKTYTITRLFLRLILEKKLSGSEILVVTFTEAATEELRDRIRSTLTDAIRTLVTGKGKDDIMKSLVYNPHIGTEQEILEQLSAAVRTFDETSIFTIHGFCQRMLSEKAFESGTLFDTELMTDQSLLVQEIVDDFWRNNFYHQSSLFIDYALDRNYSPPVLIRLIPTGKLQHDFSVIPKDLKVINTDSLENDFSEIFHTISATWPQVIDEIKEIILHAPISRSIYKNLDKNISSWIETLESLFSMKRGRPEVFATLDVFEKFTASKLVRSTKKGQKPPEHSFFTLCQDLKEQAEKLCQAFEHNLLALKSEFLTYLKNELIERKAQRNMQHFDDLLINLRNALLDTHKGQALAQAVRKKYQAALIDEFQDTDPLQWDIFRKVFNHKGSALFLIGDPKQAIYSFRGADIFTYMKASKEIPLQYTLDTNYRSSSNLITAVNTIFSQSDTSFIYEKIPFYPVRPREDADKEPLTIEGNMEPPFQLWFVSREHEEKPTKPLAKGRAEGPMAQAVSQEIGRLLALSQQGQVMVGTKPLRPEDIAVLVRSHKEANLVRAELMNLKIPCVLDGSENLFDTPEAVQIERVLYAVAEPDRGELIKAALATDIMGFSGEDIEDAVNNEQHWDALIVQFRSLNELWHGHGFMMMFRHFLTHYTVRHRLLALEYGERRLTNVLHLAEVLQRISSENKPGPAALLEWLSQQRCPDTPRLTEYELRLESDEDAVRLVTIHKSKGLEYPVVFVPFVWQSSQVSSKNYLSFHDAKDNLTLALSQEEMNKYKARAEREELAENMRLLYVALTRAKNRCYLLWGGFNKAETSAAAYLFHHKGSPDDFLTQDAAQIKKMTDNEILADLQEIEKSANNALQLSVMDSTPAPSYLSHEQQGIELTCRHFSGNLKKDWKITSFSALTRGRTVNEELPDHDSLATECVEPVKVADKPLEPSTIFDFPRGARPGTCLHEIFEDLDFTTSDPSDIVKKKLDKYNFEPLWVNIVSSMVKNVLTTPLSPDSPDFTLSRLTFKDRINEMGFYFPLSSLTNKKLSHLFSKHTTLALSPQFSQEIEQLQFSPVRGFMKGFIDLVFTFKNRYYLIDWKSNYLGDTVKQYGQEELKRVMHDDFYTLQYLIYTVALHKYLYQRIPGYHYDTHFGGAFYVFLRGIDPEYGPDYGIYRDRPDRELIEELSRIFIGESK